LIAEQGVDALPLDSGDQRLPVKVLGGTGRTQDWTTSRRIREVINVPLFLAGGLRAENVAIAIEEVQPFGVDVCSSLRTNSLLDEAKLSAFINELRKSPYYQTMFRLPQPKDIDQKLCQTSPSR